MEKHKKMQKTACFLICLFLVMGASLYGGNGVTRQTYVYNGTVIGRSYTNNLGQTRYYDNNGRRIGYSYQYGPYTRYYNYNSRYLGDVLNNRSGVGVVRPYTYKYR